MNFQPVGLIKLPHQISSKALAQRIQQHILNNAVC
jgi:hypothetical protein